MSRQWLIDPVTKDYVQAGGSPVNTSSLDMPAYIRLKTPKQTGAPGVGWLYAPDQKYGSTLASIKRQSTQSPSAVEAAAAQALQPILDDGRASQVTAAVTQSKRGSVALQVDIVDQEGQNQTLTINPLVP